MSDDLNFEDIDESIAKDIFVQDYSRTAVIKGVEFKDIANNIGEDGDLSEVLRISENGTVESFPAFHVRQVNRTQILPTAIKAWHLHFKQDELWYLPPYFHLFVGLWDLRKKSETKGLSMRIMLGGGKSQLLHIPKGVAHGYTNVSGVPVNLYYFINKYFNLKNPDERRLKWNALGDDFWTSAKE